MDIILINKLKTLTREELQEVFKDMCDYNTVIKIKNAARMWAENYERSSWGWAR